MSAGPADALPHEPATTATAAPAIRPVSRDVGDEPAEPTVRLRGLAVGYRGITVLRGIDLDVAAGELVGLVGPSGSGKTSLLRAMVGGIEQHAGTVEIGGHRVGRHAPPRVGYVPQLGSIDLDFPLTVEQVVLLGDAASSGRRPWFDRRERAAARQVLAKLGLDGLHRRRLRELSGGQLQRTFLARALVRDARLLLLDEPTSGIDLATSREVIATLRSLHADGLTIVLTTHDLNLVATHLPRTVCLQGRIVADGPPSQVFTPTVLEATYGAPMRVLEDGDRLVVIDEQVPARPPLGLLHPGGASGSGEHRGSEQRSAGGRRRGS